MDSKTTTFALTVVFQIRALLFLSKAWNLFEGIFAEKDIPILKSLYEIQPLDDENNRGFVSDNVTETYGCFLKKEVKQNLKYDKQLEQFNPIQNECLKSLICRSGLIMLPKDKALQAIRKCLENESFYLNNPFDRDDDDEEDISLEQYVSYMISYYNINIFMIAKQDNYIFVLEDDLPQIYIDFAKEKEIPLTSNSHKNSGLFVLANFGPFYDLNWRYRKELEKRLQ
jgi:hypothetical protein